MRFVKDISGRKRGGKERIFRRGGARRSIGFRFPDVPDDFIRRDAPQKSVAPGSVIPPPNAELPDKIRRADRAQFFLERGNIPVYHSSPPSGLPQSTSERRFSGVIPAISPARSHCFAAGFIMLSGSRTTGLLFHFEGCSFMIASNDTRRDVGIRGACPRIPCVFATATAFASDTISTRPQSPPSARSRTHSPISTPVRA